MTLSGTYRVVLLSILFLATVGNGMSCAEKTRSTSRPDRKGKLIFSEDFDGPSLDRHKWTKCYWWGNTIVTNNELEWYQPDNVIVEGGLLKLRAKQKRTRVEDGSGDITIYRYTSGVITTGRSNSNTSSPAGFLFRYGYAEVRAKVPTGKGLWPAFWMLPEDHNSKPEIDVMEIYGDETNIARLNFHFINDHGKVERYRTRWEGPDFSSGFHTFAVDWRRDAIVWYVDGVEWARYTDAAHIPRKPMYLLLNMAVGGNGAGSPNSATTFPSDYEVDYVRVWR